MCRESRQRAWKKKRGISANHREKEGIALAEPWKRHVLKCEIRRLKIRLRDQGGRNSAARWRRKCGVRRAGNPSASANGPYYWPVYVSEKKASARIRRRGGVYCPMMPCGSIGARINEQAAGNQRAAMPRAAAQARAAVIARNIIARSFCGGTWPAAIAANANQCGVSSACSSGVNEALNKQAWRKPKAVSAAR